MVWVAGMLLHRFEAERPILQGAVVVSYESESVQTSSTSLNGISMFVIATSGVDVKRSERFTRKVVFPDRPMFSLSTISIVRSDGSRILMLGGG